MMNVTIRQIAAQAGVSRGTVDRVLNGRAGVKPEIRQRVLSIADELNYVPNVAAKALAFNKKPVQFGIVMPPEEIVFFNEIRSGIQAAAEELQGLGIRLDYYYVNNQHPEEGAAAIRQLVADGASGIMFSVMDDEIIRQSINEAVDQGIPVVTFNSDVESSKRICFVGQDLRKSGAIAAGLMKRMLKGKSKVFVVVGSMKFHAHRSRVHGFSEGLTGSEIEIVQIIEGFDRYQDTYSKLVAELENHPDLDGIYMATGDMSACLDAIQHTGRGGNLRVVCNDLMPEIEQGMREGLIDFTIVQNPTMQGYRSLRILYDLLFLGKKPDSEYNYTETSIVIPETL
jgi:LacI family transcriptional regulator